MIANANIAVIKPVCVVFKQYLFGATDSGTLLDSN